MTEKTADEKYVEAMAKEHATDKPVETPASKIQPDTPVRDESVSSLKTLNAYLATPIPIITTTTATATATDDDDDDDDHIKATIIVIHEWWGLNDQIKSVTRQLAGQGYAALAVNLYGTAEAVSTPPEAMNIMIAALEKKEQLLERLQESITYLKDRFGDKKKMGVIGWCFGGSWSLQASLMAPMDATVIYYGHLHYEAEQLAKLKGPVLGIFGEEDKGIPLDSVKKFEKDLEEAKHEKDFHIYPGADHAFANPSGTMYNETAAKDAWEKTLDFLAKNLM